MSKETAARCHVLARGVPHALRGSCACVPCNAVRQHLDVWLASRAVPADTDSAGTAQQQALARGTRNIVEATCVPFRLNAPGLTSKEKNCSALATRQALGVSFPEPDRIHRLKDESTYTLLYQGVWCVKAVDIERCSDSHVHLRFRRSCQVEIKPLAREGESEETSIYFGDVRLPPCADQHAFFLEQWVRQEEAETVLRAFARSEEIWLEPGDTAWTEEGGGRCILPTSKQASCSSFAIWEYDSARFHVRMEYDDRRCPGEQQRWLTADVAHWLEALPACRRLCQHAGPLWMHVPGATHAADLYIRRAKNANLLQPLPAKMEFFEAYPALPRRRTGQ